MSLFPNMHHFGVRIMIRKSEFLRSALILFMLMSLLLLTLPSCSHHGPPPEVEDVYDRIVEVVEASHEVNVFLFGAGMPVYPRGDAEDELLHRYYGVADNGREYVKPYAKFATVEEMQNAVARVYSKGYRESLFESLFTGYADAGLSLSMPARYHQDERSMYQNVHVEPLVTGTRVYDFAGMEILEESYDTCIRVAIPSYSEEKPDEWVTVRLTFIYEEGNWYLDSPSC